MTRFSRKPIFYADFGPWGVDGDSKNWYVVHKTTLRAKKIGPIGSRRTNYFDRAITEANRRNLKGV